MWDDDSRGIAFFWTLIIGGTFTTLVLAGVGFAAAAIVTAIAIGAAIAVFAGLVAVMAAGAGIALAVHAVASMFRRKNTA